MKKTAILATAALFILILSGCVSVANSPNPRFYMLRAVDQDSNYQKFDILAGTIIAVGPVKIPEYLNRPQMVTKDKKGMLNFAQFDRWGELLESGITRLMIEDFTLMLPGASLQMYPSNFAIPLNYQVSVDIVQMESELNKNLLLVAQWTVIDSKSMKMIFTKRSEFTVPITPHDYPGLTEALSTAGASLSAEIAQKLSELSPKITYDSG